MKTLIKLVNGKEVARKSGYANEENAINAGNSWLRDCIVHAEIRKDRSIEVTNGLFVIRNTKTDENFDTNEMKFYGSNWEPEYTDDRLYLEILLERDPEKFENCIIEKN
jgi:hypothetical protein